MKVYSELNVYDMGIKRMEYIFDEFEEVVVGFSGGKDSTVILHLAIEVARKRNRLPIKVLFIDQEAEWQHNIDYVRRVMDMPEVEPMWFQMPIRIFNATSYNQEWLWCWKEGDEWMREKEPDAITVNDYGTDRFADLFGAILRKDFKGIKTTYVAGVRTQESPARYSGLTNGITYKWLTYGRKHNNLHYTLYPIYDWTTDDVWKAIHENDWDYTKVYDFMWQHGVAIKDMRISNLHHETAVHALYILQEIEPKTWNKLTKRLEGIDTTAKIDRKDSFTAKELPFMFSSWVEYRDFLLEKLVTNPDFKERFKKKFERMEDTYFAMNNKDDMYRVQISSILLNDWEHVKINNWERRPSVLDYRNTIKRGGSEGGYKRTKYSPLRRKEIK